MPQSLLTPSGLCAAPFPSVPSLAAGVAQVLGSCTLALSDSTRALLLDLLLALAQDDAAQAANPARALLAPPHVSGGGAPSSPGSGPRMEVPDELFTRLLEGLRPAVEAGPGRGVLHARKLSCAMLLAGEGFARVWGARPLATRVPAPFVVHGVVSC